MTRPSVLVECAPGYTPFDTSPVWVDVSSRVLSVEYYDGRRAGLTAYPPSEATIVMGNADRLLDPEYEAGTYAGLLVPRVPFRVRAVTAGPTYRTLFYGFVEGGWEQDWRPPGDMICTVTLVDWLGVIASYRLDDYLDDFVLALDPIAWWRFDETRNTNEVVDRSGNDHHGTASGAVQGEAGLTPGAGRSVFLSRGQGHAVVQVPVTAPLVLTPPFTVCWVARLQPVPAGVAAQHYIMLQINAANLSGFIITFNSYFDSDGAGTGLTEHGMLVAYQRDSSTRREMVRSESTFDDGVARFFAMVVPSWDASTWRIRFSRHGAGTSASNSVLLDNNGTTPPGSTPDVFDIGNWSGASGGADYGLSGNLDHLMLFGTDLSTAQINVLNTAVWDYNGNQTTGAGIDWVLDRIGVPAAFRDIDTGDEMLGVTTEFGALERLRGIEAVERGALYVDHEAGGIITFRSASSLAADTRITTSQHTLSDATTAGFFHYERDGLVIEANGVDSIVNRQTVEWAGGTVTVQDDASVDAYGPREGPLLKAPAEDYAAAKAIGETVVLVSKEPKTRVRSLTFDAGADESNFDLLLDLQPRDMLTLERRPLAIGDPIIQDVYYEGGKYVIGEGMRWQAQLFLSSVARAAVGAELALRWNTLAPLSLVGLTMEQASGTLTLLPHGSRVAGDRLVVHYYEVTSQTDPTTPTGWTQQATTGRSKVYSRTATGDASDNCVISGSANGAAFMATLRTAAGGVYGTPADSGTSPLVVPSATATGVGDELIFAISEGGTSAPAITTPTGFTLLANITDTNGSGNFTRGALFHRAVAGAGAVGTTNLTSFGNSHSASKVLLG